jgi:hypothetical protein
MLQSLQGDVFGETGRSARSTIDAPAGAPATGDYGEGGGACDALSTFCPLCAGFNSPSVD